MGRKKSQNGEAKDGKRGVYQEPLEVTLDPETRKARSIRLAEVDRLIDEVAAERKDTSQKHGEHLKKLREERDPLIKAVETGQETQMVECHDVHDHERGNVRTVRLDTQETIRERAMETTERQQGLGLDGNHQAEA
jgi:hypothetical protein